MATDAHTTPATRIVRRRHAQPAVALPQDRRLPAILAQPITWRDRARIERDLDLLVALLDALDGDPDREEEVDRCEAGDDEPGLSGNIQGGGARDIGSEDDAERNGDDEPTEDDMVEGCRPIRLSPEDRCSNGPLQLDSGTYATVRGWQQAGDEA